MTLYICLFDSWEKTLFYKGSIFVQYLSMKNHIGSNIWKMINHIQMDLKIARYYSDEKLSILYAKKKKKHEKHKNLSKQH